MTIGFLDFSPFIVPSLSYQGLAPRSFAGFTPEVVVEEEGVDGLVITLNPVEQGALVTDHAYKQPSTVRIICGWSAYAAAQQGTDPTSLYNSILSVQDQRQPFDVITAKRLYPSMLMGSIRNRNTSEFAYTLMLELEFQQILLASVTNNTVDTTNLVDPMSNTPTLDQGTLQPQPSNVQLPPTFTA